MRVAAISMTGINLKSVDLYRGDLILQIKNSVADLVVLPAYSSIILGISTGQLKQAEDFNETIRGMMFASGTWNNIFLELHYSIARELGIYITVGTLFENNSNRCYHTAYCINPAGQICAKQRQTHLTRAERELGLSRGEELEIFTIEDLKAGLIIGNDARHPEVGRIFGLRGADILLHSGAIEDCFNYWPQVAGMWSQVQQNQFWVVEAQLSAGIAGRTYNASSAIIGPCEITPDLSGYLARSCPEMPLIAAELDEEARQQQIEKYPLLKLLNPAAYSELKTGFG